MAWGYVVTLSASDCVSVMVAMYVIRGKEKEVSYVVWRISSVAKVQLTFGGVGGLGWDRSCGVTQPCHS